MDPARLVALARGAASGDQSSRTKKLVCKIARSHIRKKPASASNRQKSLRARAQIQTVNLTHAVVADDAIPDPEQDVADEDVIGKGRWRMWNARSSLSLLGFDQVTSPRPPSRLL